MGQSRIDRAVIEFARLWNATNSVYHNYPPDFAVPFVYTDIGDQTGEAHPLMFSHVVRTILRLVAEVEAFKEDQRRFAHLVDARMDATKKED
jgi:hypothetical protein